MTQTQNTRAHGAKIGDDAAARRVTARIKASGFTGGVCIHPSHVTIANEYFRPSAKEIELSAAALKARKDAEAQGPVDGDF